MLPPPELPGILHLRLLAETTWSETHLVRYGDDQRATRAQLVRPRTADGARRVTRLISAAARIDHTGVICALDVVADQHGIAALFEHPTGRRLSEVLAVRDSWAAGEAVAVLEPLATTLLTVHDAGTAFGGFGASTVVLADRGPVVDDLGAAALFPPRAPEVALESIPEVRADREALRALAQDLLGRVAGSRAAAARALAAEVATLEGRDVAAALVRGLRELAAPLTVRLEDSVTAPPEQTLAEPIEMPGPTASGPLPMLVALVERFVGPGLFARGREAIASVTATGAGLGHRRRLLLGALGAAIATAVVLLTVIPDTAAPQPEGDSGSVDVHSAAPSLAEPSAGDAEQVDDPLEAVIHLLNLREDCFRELSVLCLEGVNQSGSAASAADRRALEAMRAGGEGDRATAAAENPRLVERLGDSVLIEIGPETAPASLLLMRSEAGWRIRDWVAWASAA